MRWSQRFANVPAANTKCPSASVAAFAPLARAQGLEKIGATQIIIGSAAFSRSKLNLGLLRAFDRAIPPEENRHRSGYL